MSTPQESEALPPAGGTLAGTLVKLSLGLALALLFAYLFLRGSDLGKLGAALTAVDPLLLALALLIAASGLVVRAERWRVLLRPVRAVGYAPSFEILTLGYLVSIVLPGRLGDILVRPLLMNRWQGVPLAATFATVVVERLLDSLTVAGCLAVYFVLAAPPTLGEISVNTARLAGLVLLAACLVGLAFLLFLRVRPEACFRLLGFFLRPLPAGLRARVDASSRRFAQGLDLFREPMTAVWALLWSVLAWASVGVSMWLVCRGMGLTQVRLVDGVLLMGMGALGVSVPTPAGAGSVHYLMLQGLKGLGVHDVELGQAASTLIWGLSVLPVLALGALVLLRRGLSPAAFKRMLFPGVAR